ncbi:MAG TPA: putative Ig domain-containing protein, partial [Tahibacter sp.]|nr:putative Ig domain-containing protein [Tahibacter sp.]
MQSVTGMRRILAGLFAVLMVAGGAGAEPFAYVPKAGKAMVAKVDLATGTTVANIVVPGGPLASTISHGGQRVYAVLQSLGKVAVIDTASNSVVTTITVGSSPWSATLSPDDSRLYVVNNSSNTISVIDTASDTVIATMPVASQPDQLAVSPDGTRGYLTASPSTVQVLDLVNRTVITSLVTGNLPNPIVLNAAGTRAYVGYAGDSTIRVLDTTTNTLIGSIALGTNKAPNGLVLSPDQQTLYVSEFIANQAVEIDLATLTIGTTYTVGSRPYGVDISNDGTRVYVANRDGNSLSVIDTAAHAVTGTIDLGSGAQPWAIGRFIPPPNVLAITSAPPPGGKWHTPYSFDVTTTGAPVPTVSLNSGALPPGLTLSANAIAGTPTQIGTYTGVLQAVSGSTTVTQPFSITIAPDWPVPPIIDNVVPGDGEVTVYFHPAPDDGNASPTMFNAFCHYASSSPTSPIVIRGLANGQPVSCTMNAINSAGGGVAGAPFAPVIPGIVPAFDAFAPPHATWNAPYSYTVTATGSPAPTLSIADGSLPAGLTFDAASGTISGTPTALGSATVRLSATNALASVTSGDLTIVVDAVVPAAPTAVVATAGDGQVSIAFAAPTHWGGEPAGSYKAACLPGTGVATGNTSPLTVTGLANGTAVICSVSAVNTVGAGPVATAASVTPGIAPAFGAFAPPHATWNTPYSYTVTATGSPAPTLSLADGTLPAGLTFD